MMHKLAVFLLINTLLYGCSHASDLKTYSFAEKKYLVFQPASLAYLQLGLQDQQAKHLGGFIAWQKVLPKCKTIEFAMNAGMYHPNYQPVGLYIEAGKQQTALNTATGFGNFFLQPNGVVAWNSSQALISPTAQWQKLNFKADYATQSGPMLVVDGKISGQFLPDSNSKKIRNGVGIKQGKLFFVISEQAVNFYEFANFFKQGLKAEQALYLDGSISSIYAPTLQRYDRAFQLGPMLGYIKPQQC